MKHAAPHATEQPGQDLVLAALARALLITLADEATAAGTTLFMAQLVKAMKLHLDERYGDATRTRRRGPLRQRPLRALRRS